MNIIRKIKKNTTSSESLEMQNAISTPSYLRPQSLNEFGRNSESSATQIFNNDRITKSENSLDLNVQETLIKTFEKFYTKESESMIVAIEQSREEMKNSILEFFDEQSKYKEELVKASEGRYNFKRRKENEIPLAEYMRRKKDKNGITSRSTSRINTPSTPTPNQNEREAVEKYLRKRDRRKIAERNQRDRENNAEDIKQETEKILEKLQGMDITIDKEKNRQAEIVKQKLEEKKNRKDHAEIATHIIDDYQESELAMERARLAQKEKIEARLSAARQRTPLVTPTPTPSQEATNYLIGNTLKPNPAISEVNI